MAEVSDYSALYLSRIAQSTFLSSSLARRYRASNSFTSTGREPFWSALKDNPPKRPKIPPSAPKFQNFRGFSRRLSTSKPSLPSFPLPRPVRAPLPSACPWRPSIFRENYRLSKKHLALTLPLPLGKFFSFILQPFKARNKSFFVKK